MGRRELEQIGDEIARCRACERLVGWRERVAITKRAAYIDEEYWGRGVPSFGDPDARLMLLGLAPAAHGANRTGRMFTGDRSGDWLFRALHRAGFANQPESVAADDGLTLTDAWVSAAVHCAPPDNKPLPAERDNCAPFLQRELMALERLQVIVTLGGFGWTAALSHFGVRPRPRFAHAAVHRLSDGPILIGSYHPSQQNTFTKRLTEPMFDEVFGLARSMLTEA